jgi:hypothetical protein
MLISGVHPPNLTNVPLAWFDPIRQQDLIIADQSSALFSSDLCGECEMTMSDVGKKMAGRSFWGCREMVNCTTTYPAYHTKK